MLEPCSPHHICRFDRLRNERIIVCQWKHKHIHDLNWRSPSRYFFANMPNLQPKPKKSENPTYRRNIEFNGTLRILIHIDLPKLNYPLIIRGRLFVNGFDVLAGCVSTNAHSSVGKKRKRTKTQPVSSRSDIL